MRGFSNWKTVGPDNLQYLLIGEVLLGHFLMLKGATEIVPFFYFGWGDGDVQREPRLRRRGWRRECDVKSG